MGRPTAYKPEYAEHARKLCLRGATDAELAEWFEVSPNTIDNWKKAHPEFLGSLKAGKEKADALVAHSLYRRAIGYRHKVVKITVHAETGNTTITPYIEKLPPDTTAAIFWLKNRRPADWREKQTIEHDVTDGLAEKLALARKRVANG